MALVNFALQLLPLLTLHSEQHSTYDAERNNLPQEEYQLFTRKKVVRGLQERGRMWYYYPADGKMVLKREWTGEASPDMYRLFVDINPAVQISVLHSLE